MARVNVGVHPKFLSDQHLIAESVEITMITGNLKANGNVIKGRVPDRFCLGIGHINFFKDKIMYLSIRVEEVNDEMCRRGFSPGTAVDVLKYPAQLRHGWYPSQPDTDLVRARICERLKHPKKAKAGFHRYCGQPIADMNAFCEKIITSKLYHV